MFSVHFVNVTPFSRSKYKVFSQLSYLKLNLPPQQELYFIEMRYNIKGDGQWIHDYDSKLPRRLNNATDWTGDIPASCCDFSDSNSTASNSTETVKCTLDLAYTDGCKGEALDFADKAILFTFYILVIGFFIEFMCIFAACWVVREVTRYSRISG